MEELVKQYGTLGVGGLFAVGALWLLRYLVTQSIPQQQATFVAQLEKEREQCQKNHECVIETINDRHEHNMRAHADTRQEVAELANIAGLKKAVEDIRKQQQENRGA